MSAGEKIIRDPVHDVIAFALDDPTDLLLLRLVNTPEMQRLRRIRQLGLAHLAYPGAEHTRYGHSLGVMQTARRILDRLARMTRLDPEQRTACLVGALLHDLGHGPFSHVFERVSQIHHERLTRRILLDPDSGVHQQLLLHDPSLPERVADLLEAHPRRSVYSDILSSQLDADRLDYLIRDSLMTGSRYGDYDLEWLLHALTLDEPTDRLAVTAKGTSAVEAYLQSRFHMYRNVYFHKVVRCAEGMVRLAMQRARRLAMQDRLPFPEACGEVVVALTGQRLTMSQWIDLDDVSVTQCLKMWTHADDPVLAGLCRGLLHRRLYKTIDLTSLDARSAQDAVGRAIQAVEEAGGDGDYDLFLDEPVDTPYEQYSLDDPAGSEILVRDPADRLTPLGQVSPMSGTLNRQLFFRRLHVAPAYKMAASVAIAG